MIEPVITAEDLTLYALDLLEGDERVQVDAMLRKSTAAREELANIRGDLALFALAAEQHTPPALTRQRLLKQVARERRTVPVNVPVQAEGNLAVGRAFTADRAGAGGSTPAAEPSFREPETIVNDPAFGTLRQIGTPRPIHTRTFPSRSQLRAGTANPHSSGLQVPRAVQEPRVVEEPTTVEATAPSIGRPDAPSFTATPATFPAEREAFAPDPQVYPRESRALPTSATAHSVTMFEQHFAAEAVSRARESELPPDPDAYSGRKRREPADAVNAVEDQFVPSAAIAREENFGFSAYRERIADEEPRAGGLGRWIGWTGWGIAAALAVAALVALRDDFHLREQVSQQQSFLTGAQASAARAEMVQQTLQSPAAQQFVLGRTDAAPAPSGRVAYLPERGTVIFQGSNLETLQPYKTYELWLIPAGGGRQPVPAGLFKPDGHGYATVVLPQMDQKGMVAANFGVTIEDEGGSATPTLPILLVGQQF